MIFLSCLSLLAGCAATACFFLGNFDPSKRAWQWKVSGWVCLLGWSIMVLFSLYK